MKFLRVIQKSIKEQMRHIWILLLTVSMAPFFIFVYYLILESSKPHYDLLIVNQDQGVEQQSERLNYGEMLTDYLRHLPQDSLAIPLTVRPSAARSQALKLLKNSKVDAGVVIPVHFSESIRNLIESNQPDKVELEIIGNLTNVNYMVTAIWANEYIQDYLLEITRRSPLLQITETSLGSSGLVNDFDLVVPGLLILAIIMLMFSATIAVITEVENKTMIRLKLSPLTAFEFLAGISVVQIIVGLISIGLTLLVAVWLGFNYTHSFLLLLLIAVLTSISIIAFSMILAAATKTVNEVLVVGNFPLFLFMFFTGAAFPLKSAALFSIAGYPVNLQGLMSPTHAIKALNKVLIMNLGLQEILGELIVLIILTVVYFVIGLWLFQRRHMRVV